MQSITNSRRAFKATVFALLGLLFVGLAPTQATATEVRFVARFHEPDSNQLALLVIFDGEIEPSGNLLSGVVTYITPGQDAVRAAQVIEFRWLDDETFAVDMLFGFVTSPSIRINVQTGDAKVVRRGDESLIYVGEAIVVIQD